MKEAVTMGTGVKLRGEGWKKFVRRHGKMTALVVGWIVAAAAAMLLVFLWVVADAQATGLVESELGRWTVGLFFTFLLQVILWELILVASWVIPTAVLMYLLWYKKLPAEERKEYEGGPKRSRSAGEDSGISFFVGLVWLAIVWLDGKWNLAFQDWTFDDWVYSWMWAGLVVLVIVGIPGIMYLIWSLRRNGG
ncbi:MAG: hypothetical protein LN417_09780 [Candidatus Thermoplasmatota archaeon]|nr:hypothetical protein [Candidatus Thermoplasmatota archaeon]